MTTNLKPSKTGRPTKLTPALQTKICKYIADGNYISTACLAAGINQQSYLNWMHLAEQELLNNTDGIYLAFMEAAKRAEADAEAMRVSRIKKAGETNWLADMTHLERRHPDRWGRRDRHDFNINETKTINITRVEYTGLPGATGRTINGEIIEDGRSRVIEEEVKEIGEGGPGSP